MGANEETQESIAQIMGKSKRWVFDIVDRARTLVAAAIGCERLEADGYIASALEAPSTDSAMGAEIK